VVVPSTVKARWSRRASYTALSWYSSQPLSVCRASTKASRASYCPRYQLRSELSWERWWYFSRARSCSSCGQQPKDGEENQNEKHSDEKDTRNKLQIKRKYPPRRAGTTASCGAVAPRSGRR
jgi:hypothetical protein